MTFLNDIHLQCEQQISKREVQLEMEFATRLKEQEKTLRTEHLKDKHIEKSRLEAECTRLTVELDDTRSKLRKVEK